jgi:hypothetical protein
VTDRDGRLRRDLLQELLWTYGPGGRVRAVCRRELEPFVDESWVDQAGNLVGLIRGRDGENDRAVDGEPRATRVLAHLDELSMLVKRVESDGTLHLTPLGTMYPANFGLGPVAVLGESETLIGVLALGSEAHHQREPTDLGDQTRPRRQGAGLATRLRLHRTLSRRADGGRRGAGHSGLCGTRQADAGGCWRLHRFVLLGRPCAGGGAVAGRPHPPGTR